MPAEAGIQEREGMETGFRRYDGRRRRASVAVPYEDLSIHREDTKNTKVPSYRRKPVSMLSLSWMPACAGMTTEKRTMKSWFLAISFSVDELKLITTFW